MKWIKDWWNKKARVHHPVPGSTATNTYGGRGELEIKLKLEILLNITGPRRSGVLAIAKKLSAFSMADQDRFLKAVEDFSMHPDLANSLCHSGLIALRELKPAQWEEWLRQITDRLEQQSVQIACSFVEDIASYLQSIAPTAHEVTFEKIVNSLTTFLAGLSRQELKLKVGSIAYTDTDAIYLPPTQSRFTSYQENFDFYKTVLTYLWAQTVFGTWRIDIAEFLYEHTNYERAIALYQVLETLRLDACIARELPGIARLAQKFGCQAEHLPQDETWQEAKELLQKEGASSADSLKLIERVWRKELPPVAIYQGAFYPRRVHRVIRERSEVNIEDLQRVLAKLLSNLHEDLKESDSPFTIRFDEQLGYEGFTNFALMKDGQDIEMSEPVKEALERVLHDLGEIPAQYLATSNMQEPDSQQDQSGTMLGAVASLPEWDHAIQRYREKWCSVYRKDCLPGDESFASLTRAKHRGVVYKLNRIFEAMREANKISKHRISGDEIDIDQAIESTIDYFALKNEMDENIFIQTTKNRRDVAVLFMVDNSSSTHGMVNRVERESLILLCDSLRVLGDRYAIFGFSGNSRKHCDVTQVKGFDEAYDASVEQKIAGMVADGYTRIGAAARYLTQCLAEVQAKTKLLVTLSDGKPDDSDGYRNQYGIEDTRRALIEARALGILSYCITIDTQAKDYLPYMYGNSNYSVISKVEELPFKMADIYRRITVA